MELLQTRIYVFADYDAIFQTRELVILEISTNSEIQCREKMACGVLL